MDTSTMIMVQVWRDETKLEAFQLLERGFVPFLKEQGFDQAKFISQVWSSSFYRQKKVEWIVPMPTTSIVW